MLHTVVVLAVNAFELVCVHMQLVGWEESVTTPGHEGRHLEEAGALSCVSAGWMCDLGCTIHSLCVFLML